METNTEAYIRYDPTKENAWVQGVLDTLGDDYYKVVSKQLVTMLLIVIAKKSHKSFISETQVTWAGVGLMNMMVMYVYSKEKKKVGWMVTNAWSLTGQQRWDSRSISFPWQLPVLCHQSSGRIYRQDREKKSGFHWAVQTIAIHACPWSSNELRFLLLE